MCFNVRQWAYSFAVAEKKEITERILTELSELDLETAVTTTVQKERI